MSKKSAAVFGKILLVIVLLLVIGGAVACVYHFTDGGTTDFKTFYLVHNGKDIFQTESSMQFCAGDEQRFDVKYTFGLGSEKDYTVTIVPNEEESFSFTVGERRLAWRRSDELKDLTAFFSLEKGKGGFSFRPPQLMTARSILAAVFPGEAVTGVEEDALFGKELYRLIVASQDGKVTYNVDFSVLPHAVEEVTADANAHIFSESVYQIGYTVSPPDDLDEDDDWLWMLDFNAPAYASFGETVTFKADHYADGYSVDTIDILFNGSVLLHITEETYASPVIHSFQMPAGNVTVRFNMMHGGKA